VVTTTPDFITSVSSPLAVTTGNLTVDLSAYAPLASPAFTGNPTAPTATFGDNDTSISTTAFVQAALAGGTAVAKNLEVEVRNQSGSTIAAGSIVYISGATGNKPLITKAQANNDTNSAQTIGFTKTAIANNGTGFVIVRGELENIDTSALTEGVQLYLSPTTAGTWTTTKPSAPQHLVYVGIVIRSHPTLGVILVAVQNGYELNELHDVAISSVADNNLLAYEASTTLWKNKTFSALGLLTSATAASTYQTLAGMSSYLTTSTAASTYALKTDGALKGNFTLDGTASSPNSDGSILIGSLSSGYNYLSLQAGVIQGVTYASGNKSFTLNGLEGLKLFSSGQGVRFPDATTQTTAYPGSSDFLLKADNLSGLANTGTARTNLGLGTMATATAADYSTTSAANLLYYPLSSNPAGYLTSAPVTSVAGRTGAITLAVADVSGAAALASPTFSGTPSLPTGTTAVTQSPGNNTTALATTAFVTAAVPAFATDAQARQGQSKTVATSPYAVTLALSNPSTFQWTTFNSATSGAGAANNNYGQYVYEQDSPNTSVAGYAALYSNTQMSWVNGGSANRLTFTKPVWISGKIAKAGGFAGDANNSYRSYIGATDTGGTPNGGDPVAASVGIKFTGGAGQVFKLMVHNGTTQTLVSGTTTISTDVVYEWMVYSDGAGNATLFINGVQEATTSAGPTGTANTCYAVQAVGQTASAATRMILVNRNIKVVVGN
jgi:hypothetical protein